MKAADMWSTPILNRVLKAHNTIDRLVHEWRQKHPAEFAAAIFREDAFFSEIIGRRTDPFEGRDDARQHTEFLQTVQQVRASASSQLIVNFFSLHFILLGHEHFIPFCLSHCLHYVRMLLAIDWHAHR